MHGLTPTHHTYPHRFRSSSYHLASSAPPSATDAFQCSQASIFEGSIISAHWRRPVRSLLRSVNAVSDEADGGEMRGAAPMRERRKSRSSDSATLYQSPAPHSRDSVSLVWELRVRGDDCLKRSVHISRTDKEKSVSVLVTSSPGDQPISSNTSIFAFCGCSGVLRGGMYELDTGGLTVCSFRGCIAGRYGS